MAGLSVQDLFVLLSQSIERAEAALGARHVLVPLEPWVLGDETTDAATATGRGHLVSTRAGKQVPALPARCLALLAEGRSEVGRTSRAAVDVDQPTVSRLHAEINCVGGVFSLRDRGSYNGTMINHHVLEQGEAQVLRDGDVVTFGEAQLVFGELNFIAGLVRTQT
ncbi:MAG TPA: FHA domain-containing protein [Myxococcales bacterium]|nr:FHA domain-containing protein [Myxococcales bacterium]